MSAEYKPIIRIFTIDRCLRKRGTFWSWKDLRDECCDAILRQTGHPGEISRRTIMYDLRSLKEGILGFHAPIKYDAHERGYYYSSEVGALTGLNIKEKKELTTLIHFLKGLVDRENLTGLNEIITRLQAFTIMDDPNDMGSPLPVSFDPSLNVKGQNWLLELLEAIEDQKALNILYQPFGEEERNITFYPAQLKQFNGRWFAFGHTTDHDLPDLIHIGLDRIVHTSPSMQPYIPTRRETVEDYLKMRIGVSNGDHKSPVLIGFRVVGKDGNYILSKPIHRTQTCLKKTSEYIDFEVRLIPNYEFYALMLSYGSRLTLLYPDDVIDKMRAITQEMASLYPK